MILPIIAILVAAGAGIYFIMREGKAKTPEAQPETKPGEPKKVVSPTPEGVPEPIGEVPITKPRPVVDTPETLAPVNTPEQFSERYGVSIKAAKETASRYKANPASPEFANLTEAQKADLARIASFEGPAVEPEKIIFKPDPVKEYTIDLEGPSGPGTPPPTSSPLPTTVTPKSPWYYT